MVIFSNLFEKITKYAMGSKHTEGQSLVYIVFLYFCWLKLKHQKQTFEHITLFFQSLYFYTDFTEEHHTFSTTQM